MSCPEKSNELAKPNPFQKGQVNHIHVEEVMNEPDAVMGMFPLNSIIALVLFDTRASHSLYQELLQQKMGSPLKPYERQLK
jgi:hypothetical protein